MDYSDMAMSHSTRITYLGRTTFRNPRDPFWHQYHVGLVLANQFLDQLESEIRDAVLGNVGTLVSFRVGPKDASLIAKEFDPTFEPTDLLNLPITTSTVSS